VIALHEKHGYDIPDAIKAVQRLKTWEGTSLIHPDEAYDDTGPLHRHWHEVDTVKSVGDMYGSYKEMGLAAANEESLREKLKTNKLVPDSYLEKLNIERPAGYDPDAGYESDFWNKWNGKYTWRDTAESGEGRRREPQYE
jgi:hypothetical protein